MVTAVFATWGFEDDGKVTADVSSVAAAFWVSSVARTIGDADTLLEAGAAVS